MRVHNIRLGFATNSSSSHSIVFWPEDLPIPPTDEFHQFGWENFTVSDREGKRNYLAYQLFESIRSKFTKNHTYGTPEYTEAEGKAVQVLEELFDWKNHKAGAS